MPSDEQGEDDVDHGRHEECHGNVLGNLSAGHSQGERCQSECEQGWEAVVDLPGECGNPEVGVSREDHPCYHDDGRKGQK